MRFVDTRAAVGAHDIVERNHAQQLLHVGPMHHRQQQTPAHQAKRGVQRVIGMKIRDSIG